MPLHVSSTRVHRQEAKIVPYSLWYHHTYRRPSRAMCSFHGIYDKSRTLVRKEREEIPVIKIVNKHDRQLDTDKRTDTCPLYDRLNAKL